MDKVEKPTRNEYYNIRPDGKRGIVRDRIEKGNGIVECCLCHNLYDGSGIEWCPYCAYTPMQRIEYLRNKRAGKK